MTKRLLVTTVDANPINQNALRILLKSLPEHLRDTCDIYVVHSPNAVFFELQRLLGMYGASTYSSQEMDGDDPYRVKLLLVDFLSELDSDHDGVLYLDPDHIVAREFSLEGFAFADVPDSMIVSSELRDFDKEILPDQLTYDSPFHFNTSLVYGKLEVWHKLLRVWRRVYLQIEDHVAIRHREEIALTIAAYQANILLNPV